MGAGQRGIDAMTKTFEEMKHPYRSAPSKPAYPIYSGKDPICRKCGNEGARTEFHNSGGEGELVRECHNCRFRWIEAPLDSLK